MVLFSFAVLGQSIPIIPWTHYQEILLMSPPYLLLLHKLGFHLPGDVGKLFPRIPHFWTSDVLLSVANKLGPIPTNEVLNFDLANLLELMKTAKKEGETLSMPPPSVAMGSLDCPSLSDSDMSFNLPGIGMGSNFMGASTSYAFGPASHSVNWMALVHKSKQLGDGRR